MAIIFWDVACHIFAGERQDDGAVPRRRAFALQKRSGAKLERTSLSTDVFVRAPSKLLRHPGCASFEFVTSHISAIILQRRFCGAGAWRRRTLHLSGRPFGSVESNTSKKA